MTDHILIERPEAHPGVMVIRMNRPDKKNALTRAMYHTMANALVEANDDDAIRAVVILGSPGSFSSGNDLNDFMAIAMDPSGAVDVHRFIFELARFGKILVSGVDGLAIGIGTTMNLHCDMTFATPRSLFKTPFVDLALVPEAASSLLGPAIMGHQRAFAMFAAGIGFTAQEAETGRDHLEDRGGGGPGAHHPGDRRRTRCPPAAGHGHYTAPAQGIGRCRSCPQ